MYKTQGDGKIINKETFTQKMLIRMLKKEHISKKY